MAREGKSDAPSINVLDRSGQPLKPSEVLERAAALIEPEGRWIQGEYGQNGCYCAIGAIGVAAGMDPEAEWRPGQPVSVATLYLTRTISGAIVPDWNDADERTQAEVVAALRQAAELARSEGQ